MFFSGRRWACNNTEDGWMPVRYDTKEGGVCLKAFETQATWEDAQKTCRQNRCLFTNLCIIIMKLFATKMFPVLK